jgi:hypothetical protein
MTSSSTSNGWHERPGRAVTGRLWPLIAIPLLILALGLAIRHFGLFPAYREFASASTVPETLARSGRTGREFRLLEYRPLAGLRLAGFDNTLPPEAMPSTVILEPEVVRSGLPIISVVVDSRDLLDRDTGLVANYEKRGRGWERPAYASYFRDGRLVWATGAGLRIHGGSSRSYTYKSFRLHFREIYGLASLRRDLVFGGVDTPARTLAIISERHGTEDKPAYFLNPIAYEIAERTGCITVASQPVKYYLNGVDQGPYALTEHITTDFLVARFGHDDFFLAETRAQGGELRSSLLRKGSQAELREMFEWPRSEPAPSVAEVERRVDLENLSNWWILNLYIANTDPFQGYIARDRTRPDGRWFWITWDLDNAFMDWWGQVSQPWEIDNFTGVRGLINSGDLRAVAFNQLRLASPEYRRIFLSRLAEVLNHELTHEFMAELIDRYEAAMAAFGIEDQAYVQTLRDYAEHRPAVLRAQMDAYFSAGPSHRLTVTAPTSLGVRVDGREMGERYSGWYFPATPAHIQLGSEAEVPQATWRVNGEILEPGASHIELELSAETTVEVLTGQ